MPARGGASSPISSSRLSATQTITRPVFADLNPATSLGAPPNVIVPNPSDPYVNARRGNSGNPFLQPLRSDNFDASLEYYFSPTGFGSVAVFRRDLNGFIQNRDLRFIDPTLGPLIISAPVNSGRGRIDGIEGQIQTFFDFDFVPQFARGFGVQANYTYLGRQDRLPERGGCLHARSDPPASRNGRTTLSDCTSAGRSRRG